MNASDNRQPPLSSAISIHLALEDSREVEEFGSGELALDFLREDREIALLVTDIQLTGSVTGWDVAEAYRAANAATKIVYYSGNSPNQLRQVANSTFIPKPCRMELILKAAPKTRALPPHARH